LGGRLRCGADPLDAPQDAAFLQHGQRAGIGDAFHAAALKDQVAERVIGSRHEATVAGDLPEDAAEATRLAKLSQNAQREKKPTSARKEPRGRFVIGSFS